MQEKKPAHSGFSIRRVPAALIYRLLLFTGCSPSPVRFDPHPVFTDRRNDQ